MTNSEVTRLDILAATIEQRYANHPLASGAVGGTFGEILCHELHCDDDPRPGRTDQLPLDPLTSADLAEKIDRLQSLVAEQVRHGRRLEGQHPAAGRGVDAGCGLEGRVEFRAKANGRTFVSVLPMTEAAE